MEIERCFICDAGTGQAGPGDGSRYDSESFGPYCEDCWYEHRVFEGAFRRVTDRLAAAARKAATFDALLDAVKSETHRLDHGFEHDALPWLRRVLEGLRTAIESAEKAVQQESGQ